jgi:EmrB/QacA subfamily drug resistance transporter
LEPQWIVAVVFVGAMFMSIMDTTIVNVALPSIARDFHVSATSTDGVVIGYLVSLAVWIPASGWIGDRFGTKRTFLFALATFVVGSAACGQARSLTALVLCRVVQGVGGGMLTPVGWAMLFRAFPPDQRIRVSRLLIIPTALAPATGPIIGGLLVDKLSWRWVFYINLPLGLMVFLFGLAFLEEHREPLAGRLDVAGFVLSGVGFAAVLYAVAEAPSMGWTSVIVIATGTLGVGLIALLIRVEARAEAPMITLRLFRDRLFRQTNMTSFVAVAAFLGVLFVTPLYLQVGRNASPLMSGLTTFPEAIGIMVSSQLVGRLYPRVGPRRLMTFGLIWMAGAISLLTLLGHGSSFWWYRLIIFLVGVGMAFVLIPLQAATFANISPADTGRASALFNAQRYLAGAVGVAILASVVGQNIVQGDSLQAFRRGFFAAAAIALMGSFVAARVRDEDAAATMVKAPSRRRDEVLA